MIVKSISVSSQRTLPHPNIDYASVSGFISLSADLSEDDNASVCAKKLQAQVDNLVEQHIEGIAERMKQRTPQATKAQSATALKTAGLAEKHGGF